MKNPNGTISFTPPTIDPYVQEAIEDGRVRAARRGMTPGQRKRAIRDQARVRLQLDLPQWIKDDLEKKAAELGVPVSQLACYFILCGMDFTPEGTLEEMRKITRSMRYEFCLPIPNSGGAKRNR